MIMPVVRAVCRKQVSSIDHDRRPAFQAKNSATTTPSAADSVAVATPVYRLPMTMPKITIGGIRCTDRRSRSASGGSASRGTSPLIMLLTSTKSMKKPVSSRPGITPAMNSLPIEFSVSDP